MHPFYRNSKTKLFQKEYHLLPKLQSSHLRKGCVLGIYCKFTHKTNSKFSLEIKISDKVEAHILLNKHQQYTSYTGTVCFVIIHIYKLLQLRVTLVPHV